MTIGPAALAGADTRASARPPGWMITVTAILAIAVLAMAIAETNLWLHYLIDAGEPISLAGLAFVAIAGVYLYSRAQLRASLLLMAPWLLFPVITQGDQLIDNLSINWMRFIVHVLLALIFGLPVVVTVAAVRSVAAHRRPRGAVATALQFAVPGVRLIDDGRVREGSALLASFLLMLLIGVAANFLGLLMVVTLVGMIWAVLAWGFRSPEPRLSTPVNARASEKRALTLLLVGIVASLGLFLGYKNRPGAYQGSPAFFMDPAQRTAGFQIDRLPVPPGPIDRPRDPELIRDVLSGYGRAFVRLLDGYYVLDRNYNYDFHNQLFLRHTPLLANYRAVGLNAIHEAEDFRVATDALAERARPQLAPTEPLGALLQDVRLFADFTFGRASVLERMAAEFVKTQAGLQHATHLYEGEGKMLGVRLHEIADKHRRVLTADATAQVTANFVNASRSVHERYATRIVGF